MTNAEKDILRYFRKHHVGANEMLFFNNAGTASDHPSKFVAAMSSLIESGLVTRERHRNAYSLTYDGYTASRSA